MKDQELREREEVLVHDVGDTEFTNTGKEKKIKRLIIFSAIILVIVAIVVIIILVTKSDDSKDNEDEGEDVDDKKYKVLFNDSQFIKPKNFIKQYEFIQLKDSKYKFFLIHDPKTVTEGIEIRTKFGFATDIIDGFAHYAEHVFFEGTKEINEFNISSLIGQYDEFANAYTWDEETVFQFFGANNTFETILDYISKFIQKPVLNSTKFRTEINAVTSEYDSYNNSGNNEYDILLENVNQEHGIADTITGHCGNNKTLGVHTDEQLRYYLKNYFLTIFKPENCVFLIYSSRSLNEMRDYALKYYDFTLEEPEKEFKEEFNKKNKTLDYPLFNEGQLGKIAIFNSLRETPALSIIFPISQKSKYVEAAHILYYLFNGYGEGSLQKFLFNNNFVSNIGLYAYSYYRNYEIVEFMFQLTEKGKNNIDTIIEAFFSSINAIKEDKNMEELLKNFQLIDQKEFQFKEETKTVFPDDIDSLLSNYALFGIEYFLGNPIKELYTKARVNEIFQDLSPENTFIFIDSPDEISSSYLTSKVKLYTKNFGTEYRINKITDDLLNKLKNIKSVGDYNFSPREKNEEYTKLEGLTEQPCYKNSSKKCEYNEYDPNNANDTEPYQVLNTSTVLSLMKIDRSFGIPFVKGYIDIQLNNDYEDYLLKTDKNKALFYLLLYSFNYKFSISPLYEVNTLIEIEISLETNIRIYFSTYNDLLNKVIDFIINCFNEPINEEDFKTIKELYYLQKAKNHDSPFSEFRNEVLNIFINFITVETYEFEDFSIDNIRESTYLEFKNMHSKINSIITSLKYLTYGDISFELANSTTEKLSSLIKEQDITLQLKSVRFVDIPENKSILYSTTSKNIYQTQGMTLVMYEFDRELLDKMTMYTICAYDIIFNYIRTERGSGYVVQMYIKRIYDKNLNKNRYYLAIICLGKFYSPEKMDRLVNEAIKDSFNHTFPINLIDEYLTNRELLRDFPQERYEDLIYYLDYYNSFQSLKNDEKTMTYESIIEDLQDVLVNKPKRISILYHRGDITEEELEKQKSELDEYYYLNPDIKNEVTTNITYLETFLSNNY